MEPWVLDNISISKDLIKMGLCNHCLGRMFGRLGNNMTNDERGLMIREELAIEGFDTSVISPCPLCDDIFSLIGRFAEVASNKISSISSQNFLIGTRVDPYIIKKENSIIEQYNLKNFENIKSELNREIGKIVLSMIHRPVEFKNPQVVACIDTRFADITLSVSPIFIAGRYVKYSRKIPQTLWPCNICHGKGCDHCHGNGKMYPTSVQEIIGDIAVKMSGGKKHFFHGMGREDIDARMLGDGRPFVLEVSDPRVRDIDLHELQNQANQSGIVCYKYLRFVQRDIVKKYKNADASKTYHIHVTTNNKVNKERVIKVALSFEGVSIDQRTPLRVQHRRADIVRKRNIHWIKACTIAEYSFDLELETDSGTYIKEFISGDMNRSIPSFSGRLGIQCEVETLDVLAINYHES